MIRMPPFGFAQEAGSKEIELPPNGSPKGRLTDENLWAYAAPIKHGFAEILRSSGTRNLQDAVWSNQLRSTGSRAFVLERTSAPSWDADPVTLIRAF